MTTLRVLELFCGIGGLHWALKETGVAFEVIAALEINPTVLETYALNFPHVNLMRRNIESLTAEEINAMNIDAIVMSPPCQPFCRTGNRQGLQDTRSNPLSHLLSILPDLKFKYMFLENVQGFETSDARDQLMEALTLCGFKWQEFLANPKDFGVPNSRLRYYLIGKHSTLAWSFDLFSGVTNQLPDNCDNIPAFKRVRSHQAQQWSERRLVKMQTSPESSFECWRISDILEDPEEVGNEYYLPPEKLSKYLTAIDIVTPCSGQSCCFTKAYFHYLTGSGSILKMCESDNTSSELREGNVDKHRYFTPREVSRLLCYPEEFKFPDKHSPKQCFRGLGNSVNVYIVALMFSLLFEQKDK